MRRVVLVVALIVSSALVVGCSDTTTEKKDTATTAATEASEPEVTELETTESTTAAPTTKGDFIWGETAVVGQPPTLETTVGKPEIDTTTEFKTEGTEVWVALITVKNVGAEQADYNALAFEAQDAEDFKYTAFGMTSKQQLSSGNLPPGKSVKGYVAFDLPKGKVVKSITYTPDVFGGASGVWQQAY